MSRSAGQSEDSLVVGRWRSVYGGDHIPMWSKGLDTIIIILSLSIENILLCLKIIQTNIRKYFTALLKNDAGFTPCFDTTGMIRNYLRHI